MLKMRDVVRRRGRRRVLDGLNLDVARGAVCVLRGENGSGKTTLLDVASGVLPADSGTASIDGVDVGDRRARASLGYAPAAASVPEQLAVHEWLDLVAALRGVSTAEVDAAASVWRVDRWLGARIGTLSLGERRRLVLASAELGDPALLLLDEPTVGLDAEGQALLVERLHARAAAGNAALVASHDAELVSDRRFEVHTLRDGRIEPH